MSKYTAEDFANAEFAELPKYGIRAHKSAGNSFWQRDGITRATDEEMADAGWVPAPDQVPGRTITASEFDEAVESCITEDATVPPHKFAERLGVVCVPDPEPPESVPGRTITRSDYQKLMDDTSMPYGVGFTDGFHQAGGSIIDDPKPTNAEQIIDLMGLAPANLNRRDLAVWLDKAGVKSPGGSR